MPYPTENDVRDLLSAGGVDTSAIVDPTMRHILGWAVGEWEHMTGWFPFIGDTADVTRRYDPPGPDPHTTGYFMARGGFVTMKLNAGLLSVTSLTIGKTVFTPGTVLTKDVDYFLLPFDAPFKHKPYTEIRFAYPIWGISGSIEIVGKWGYWTDIDADPFYGVLCMAAHEVLMSAVMKATKGGGKWTLGSASMDYGGSPYKPLLDNLKDAADEAISSHQRIDL